MGSTRTTFASRGEKVDILFALLGASLATRGTRLHRLESVNTSRRVMCLIKYYGSNGGGVSVKVNGERDLPNCSSIN